MPVRCGVWNHVVFVNLDGNAPPLEGVVKPAAEEFTPLDLDIRSQDFVCMQLQQNARGSAVSDEVLFSPTWEANVQNFQKWVIDRLEAGTDYSGGTSR